MINIPNDFTDDLVHGIIIVMAFIVLGICAVAYSRKRTNRYFLLLLAFVFLALSQTITGFETFFLSDDLLMIPYIEVHVTHLFDLATLLSFGLALTRT